MTQFNFVLFLYVVSYFVGFLLTYFPFHFNKLLPVLFGFLAPILNLWLLSRRENDISAESTHQLASELTLVALHLPI